MTEIGEGDIEFAWADAWLSVPRFRRYVDACGGSRERALRLYEWNLDLGAVLMKDISRFEVALRNAYDRVMCERVSVEEHWLFDEKSPVVCELFRRARSGEMRDANALNRRMIREATPRGTHPVRPESVVAHLPFGFWAHLTDRAHERILWIPCLRHAWPLGTSRSELDAKIRSINVARNRIAHHERLFAPADPALEPVVIDRLLVELFDELVPEANIYAGAQTPVERFLAGHPYADVVKEA